MRLFSSAYWNLVAAVILRIFSMLCTLIAAWMLGKNIFGEYAVIYSTMLMFTVLAGFGLGTTALRQVAASLSEGLSRAENIAGRLMCLAIITSIFTAVLCFIFSPFIAVLLGAPHLVDVIRIVSLISALNGIFSVQNGILAGMGYFKWLAICNGLLGLISAAFLGLGIFLNGLEGGICAIAVSHISIVIINQLYMASIGLHLLKGLYWNGLWDNCRELLLFSVRAFLSGLMVFPLAWLCNVILVNQESGYGEAALFYAANQWKLPIIFIPAALIGAFMPVLSELFTQNETNRFRKLYFSTIRLGIIVAILTASIIIMFSGILMSIYGTGFEAGQTVVILVAITGIIESYTTIAGQVIISAGAVWPYMYRCLLSVIVIVFMAVLLIPNYMAVGLALAYFSGQVVLAASFAVYWTKIVHSMELPRDYLLKKPVANEIL